MSEAGGSVWRRRVQGDLAVELWREKRFCWVVVVPADDVGVERFGYENTVPGLPWDGYLARRLMFTKWGARREGARMVAAVRAGKQPEPLVRIVYPVDADG